MKHLKLLTIVSVLITTSLVLSACTKTNEDEPKEEAMEDKTNESVNENNLDKEESDAIDTESEDSEEIIFYKNVTPSEAQDLIKENDDLLIIDVSPNYDAGHLLNSVNYYVGDGSLDEAVSSFDKERPYLVYCHVDSAAILGAEKLAGAGIENVYRLEGNYSGWVEAFYPVITNLPGNNNSIDGDLEDVTDGDSSGKGYILRDDKLNHKVTANLPDLEEGKFYEGWLVNKSKGSDFFSTGKMVKIPAGVFVLEYVSDELREGYDYAVITLETEDDGKPEEHIIEGSIK
ncbi:MAG: hypothetical protein HQ538_04990 [Parcubacteria group bacterium]|nr:hypothetical protein [Parcubacteria group bacterium]